MGLRVLTLAILVMPAVLLSGAQSSIVPFERVSALKTRYPFVRFSTLGSVEVPADALTLAQLPHRPATRMTEKLTIPAAVQALHATKASVRGYMLPLDVNRAGVPTFILTASIDSCHWGTMGLPNEWVLVTMAGGARVPFTQFQPVTVFGLLKVAPEWTDDQLTGLFELTADFIAADGL